MFNLSFNNYNEISDSLLLCNECKNELLKIISMEYDDRINDYLINFECSKKRSKDLNKIYLKKYLITQNSNNNISRESPYYCPYHEYSPAPFYCPECNEDLCKSCYEEHILYEQNEQHFYINLNRKNNIYISGNIDINNKLKKIKNFIKNNLNNLNEIINKAHKLKSDIENVYQEFLNNNLSIINLYKLYLYKSKKSNDNNIIINIINNFSFENKKNIIEEALNKLNKEKKIIEESFNIYAKTLNLFFSKINFNYLEHYNKNNLSKLNKIQNPFLISLKPKKFFGSIKQLNNHKDEIYSLIKLKNGNFVSGAGDGKVLVWDDYLLDLNLTIHAHKGSVNTLCEINNLLITGGNDFYIQVWDINDDYNNIKKIKMNGPLINIFNNNENFFSVFANNLISLYKIKNFEKNFEFKINDIYSLEYLNNNNYAAGLDDNSIIIFNIFDEKMKQKKILKGNDEIISCIKYINERYIISGNYNGDLIIWDLYDIKLDFKISKAHLYKINCIIRLNDGTIASCSNDKTIKIWDLNKQINILTFKEAHEKSINNIIQLNNGMIISAGKDSLIKIWN